MSEQVSFGYQDVDPQEKTRRVGEVFSGVAKKYDVMNDAMSGGMHRLWKDRFVRRVKPQEGEAILDMAGGTGDIAFRMADRGASVTVADINQEMLDVGVERALERGERGGLGAGDRATAVVDAAHGDDSIVALAAGAMLRFMRNRLPGSKRRFSACSRGWLPA